MANRDRELLIPVAHSGEDDHDSTPKPSPSSSSSSHHYGQERDNSKTNEKQRRAGRARFRIFENALINVAASQSCSLMASCSSVFSKLFSQNGSVFCSYASSIGEDIPADASSLGENTPAQRRERKKWIPTDDVLLISSWLNTSKDPFVGNEQKFGVFWKRIAAYFAASPKATGRDNRETMQCKQQWQKMNDLVCKFCGSYEAATKEKSSGQNENDILKLAHEIFYNNHKKKFTLEHVWKELRNDQKWCDLSTTKTDGSSKRRRCEDGSQSSSSIAEETKTAIPGSWIMV